MADRTPQKTAVRFGPRKSVARTGVPADHFVQAPDPLRDVRRAMKAVRREIGRRRV